MFWISIGYIETMRAHFYSIFVMLLVVVLSQAQTTDFVLGSAFGDKQLEVTTVSSSPLTGVVPGAYSPAFIFSQTQRGYLYRWIKSYYGIQIE